MKEKKTPFFYTMALLVSVIVIVAFVFIAIDEARLWLREHDLFGIILVVSVIFLYLHFQRRKEIDE